MNTRVNLSLQLLVNIGLTVDIIYGNCISSDKIGLLKVTPKSIFVVTLLTVLYFIQSDPIFLSIWLSNNNIQHSIVNSPPTNLSHTLQKFNKQQLNDRVLMLCATSCLQDKIFKSNLFYHHFFWLLIYTKYEDFTKDSTTISKHIRVDSEIYALIPDNKYVNKWLLIKLKPKEQYNNKVKLKTLAIVNTKTEIQWINEPQEFYQSLQGYNFTAAMFHWHPLSEVTRTKEGISVKGVHYNLMLIYSRYLGFKFKYEIIYAKDDQYDFKLMSVWNLQRHKLREKQVTMSGMFMPITRDVLLQMSHSSFIFSSRSAVIFNNIKYNSQSQYNLSAYSKPFTCDVWICVFLIAITCLILSFISSARSYTHKFNGCQYWYEWIRLFIKDTLTPYPSQGLNFVKSPVSSKKIFTIVLLLFTVLVTVNYESVLTSFLAAERYKIPFEMLEDLINDGRFTLGTLDKSSMDSVITNSKTGVLFTMQNKSMYHTFLTMNEAYRRILTKNFAAIVPIEFTNQLNCSYAFLKTTYIPFEVAVNFPYNSPYVEIFSKIILRMRSAGILHKVVGGITSKYRPQCEYIQEVVESVNLTQSVVPFLILSIGISFAFLIFVGEIVLKKIIDK